MKPFVGGSNIAGVPWFVFADIEDDDVRWCCVCCVIWVGIWPSRDTAIVTVVCCKEPR